MTGKITDMNTARRLTRIGQDLQALVGMMALVNISAVKRRKPMLIF